MKNRWIIVGAVGASILLGGAAAAAHTYNPIKWIKKGPSPTKDACAGFKSLNDCVASLHVSHNLSIKFNCLKWDVTGAKPAGDVKSCAAPSNDRTMDLSKAIRVLKPDANSRTEAKNAEKRAREDIKDAS